MPGMYLHLVFMDNLPKTKKEYKNLKKQKILDILIKTNKKKHVLSTTWLVEILKI